MQPYFSIIIPTHNRSVLLKRAITSVVSQSYENWELIIIDDGSTDDTRNAVESFTDHRINYYYQEHAERSTARNKGIEKACGQYICFLDDDDVYLNNHLDVLYKAIIKQLYPIKIFRTGFISHYINKKISHPFYYGNSSRQSINFFLDNMVGIHTLCFHQEILKKHKFDIRWLHFQDTHLLIRCLLDFELEQIYHYTCIYYRHHQMGSNNLFVNNSLSRTENNIQAIQDLFHTENERLNKVVPAEKVNELVSEKYLDHAFSAISQKKNKLARVLFRKSLSARWSISLLTSYIKLSLLILIKH